jgi:hypothetical protein
MKRRSFLAAFSALPFVRIDDWFKAAPVPDISDIFDLFRVVYTDELDYLTVPLDQRENSFSWTVVPSFTIVPFAEYYQATDWKPPAKHLEYSASQVIDRDIRISNYATKLLNGSISQSISNDLFHTLLCAGIETSQKKECGVIFGSPELKERLMHKSSTKIVEVFELGEDQDLQKYFEDKLGGCKEEIAIAVNPDPSCFILGQPNWGKYKVSGDIESRNLKATQTLGIAVMDSRNVQILKAKDIV